ncbi:SpoIIAA family protein [Rubrobacter aplysinae]|uniref:STAS/SEC14 domain-containing protein n=1 Tax=Rubrobacter aplysinae TaxID=909625 RepID=UPI00069D8469|nr:STAS/SEC14 domain-containing protein [Rubrobacter aplysinae]
MVYEELGSMGPKALWEDTKLETSIFQNAERMAVVSEKRWIEDLAENLGSSTSMEIENFEPGQRDEALAWLKG